MSMRHPYQRDEPNNPIDVESTVDGLRFIGPGGPSKTIPWADVRSVRLYVEFRRSGRFILGRKPRAIFVCEVGFRGFPTLAVPHDSINPSSGGDYCDLVEDIHRHLARAGKRYSLRAGLTWRRFIALHWWDSIAFFTEHWAWAGVLVLLHLDRTVRAETAAALSNRPRQYRVDAIPQALLPDRSAAYPPTSPAPGSPQP
ncbi:MAG: hypothetical protein KIT67_03605 [Alphaproteobacteria bacterium]|nr:hypothetical protein [Alphaproteobacteria bacterium]